MRYSIQVRMHRGVDSYYRAVTRTGPSWARGLGATGRTPEDAVSGLDGYLHRRFPKHTFSLVPPPPATGGATDE
jgi:hypothetical protein